MTDKLRVLVASNLSEEELVKIGAVGEGLEVIAAYPLFRAERQRLSARGGLGENLDNLDPELRRLLAEAEVLFCDRLPVSILPLAPQLKWAQLSTVGADAVIGRQGALPLRVTVARGTPPRPISPNLSSWPCSWWSSKRLVSWRRSGSNAGNGIFRWRSLPGRR